MATSFSAVILDVAILLVTVLAVKASLIPSTVLVGVICTMVGGRATSAAGKYRPPGGGQGGGSSIVGAVLFGAGVSIHHFFIQNDSTVEHDHARDTL